MRMCALPRVVDHLGCPRLWAALGFWRTLQDHTGSRASLVTPRARKVFEDGDLSRFSMEQLVSVEKPWRVLLGFIISQKNRRALVRAPPSSGKSFLGQLAAQ